LEFVRKSDGELEHIEVLWGISILNTSLLDKVMRKTDNWGGWGGIFHREFSNRGVWMAAHFHQQSRFKMRGAVPPLLISFHGTALNYAQGQLSLNSTLLP
jgi:hypothetical protein